VSLRRGELEEKPTAAGHAFAARAGHVNLSVDYHDPGPLVHLVVRKALSCPEIKGDRPRLGTR